MATLVFYAVLVFCLGMAYSLSAVPSLLLGPRPSNPWKCAGMLGLPLMSLLFSWWLYWRLSGVGVDGWIQMMVQAVLVGFTPMVQRLARRRSGSWSGWLLILFSVTLPALIAGAFATFAH
ncbi:MAG: hypothetical protein AB1898_15795 [Acidobacteriota bacterium]